jgi:hypothetical protein
MHYQRVQREGAPGPVEPQGGYGREPDAWLCDCPDGPATRGCGPMFPNARECVQCGRPRLADLNLTSARENPRGTRHAVAGAALVALTPGQLLIAIVCVTLLFVIAWIGYLADREAELRRASRRALLRELRDQPHDRGLR